MIYPISFLIIILFSNIHGSCLIFNHHKANSSTNQCTLVQSNDQGYKQCLRCFINKIITPLDNITFNESCSPIRDNHCVDLYFNTTISYKIFSIQYTDLINKLFDIEDGTNSKTQNTLYI